MNSDKDLQSGFILSPCVCTIRTSLSGQGSQRSVQCATNINLNDFRIQFAKYYGTLKETTKVDDAPIYDFIGVCCCIYII